MKLTLKRIALKADYTIGKLYVDGKYFCDTIEDKVRDINKNGIFDNGEKKVYGLTAIPYGTYKITLTMSAKFHRVLPLLHDVSEYEGVRIHSGNTAADSLGCIIVGENKAVGKVINSRVTEKRLVEELKKAKDEITITIE